MRFTTRIHEWLADHTPLQYPRPADAYTRAAAGWQWKSRMYWPYRLGLAAAGVVVTLAGLALVLAAVGATWLLITS